MLQTIYVLQQAKHAVGSCRLTISAACMHAVHVLIAVDKGVAASQQVFYVSRCYVCRLQTASMLHQDSI